jgi:hypothetical protein
MKLTDRLIKATQGIEPSPRYQVLRESQKEPEGHMYVQLDNGKRIFRKDYEALEAIVKPMSKPVEDMFGGQFRSADVTITPEGRVSSLTLTRYTVSLKSLPYEIERLDDLESLDIRGTAIKDFEPLKKLQSLKTLRIAPSKLMSLDISPLSDIKTLERLDIWHAYVDLEPLLELESLRYVDVDKYSIEYLLNKKTKSRATNYDTLIDLERKGVIVDWDDEDDYDEG